MYPPITLNKNSQFFVAMCKDANSVHSFISLGVEINNKQVLLGSFGKVISRDSSTCCFLFGETSGRIINERIFFTQKNEKIRSNMTYKAWSLSLQQYMEFLAYMREISMSQKSRSPLDAYCPVSETDTEVTLEWQSVENKNLIEPVSDEPEDLDEYKHIGLINTCRHSAIKLTQKASQLTDLGQGISSIFTLSAPLTTQVTGGIMGTRGEHIYILPLPPRSFPGLCEKKMAIIKKLYERLDTILLVEQNKKSTINKFEKIKSLYDSITSKEQASMSEVFNEISCWVDSNKQLISTHRKSHWISFPTATEKMFKQLLEDNQMYKTADEQSATQGFQT